MLREFALKHGAAIMVIHHTRKSKDDSNKFNEALGSTAMQGAFDAIYKIEKKNISDNEAVLAVLSRHFHFEDIAMEFDRENLRWKRIANEQERAIQREKDAFLNNDFRIVIRRLLDSNDGSWQGTISELITESGKYLEHGIYEPRAAQASHEISKIDRLLLKYDDIAHVAPNPNGGKKGRRHWFYYKQKRKKQTALPI